MSKPLVVGPNGKGPVCLGCLCPIIYDVMSDKCPLCKWPMCFLCLQSETHKLECQAMQNAGFSFDENALRGRWHNNGVFSIFPGIWLLVARVLLTGNAPVLLKMYRKEDHDICDARLHPGGASFIRDTLKLKQFGTDDIYRVTRVLLKSLIDLNPTRDDYNQSKTRMGSGVHTSDVIHLQHSCLPNIKLIETYEEPEILKAIAAADIAEGEMLCNAKYNFSVFCTRERLFAKFCTCLRCVDPTELGLYLGSYRCQDCPGTMIPKWPLQPLLLIYTCEKCRVSKNCLPFYLLELKIEQEFVSLMDGKDLYELAKFIDKHTGPKGFLHCNHYRILIAKLCYCEFVFKQTSTKGAAFQFSTSVLQRFYKYTHELMTVFSKLRLESYVIDYQSKMMRSRHIVHDWVKGNLSTKKAEVQLSLMLREAQVMMNSFRIMDRNEKITIMNAYMELLSCWTRIHPPK